MPIVVKIEEPHCYEDTERVIDGFQIVCTTCGSRKIYVADRRYSEEDMPPKVYGNVLISCFDCREARVLVE